MNSSDNLKAEIAKRIRLAREAMHLTQEEFCQAAGMKLPSLRDYELGNSIPGGKALADIQKMKINTNWLLNGVGEAFIGDDAPYSVSSPVNPFKAEQTQALPYGFLLVPRYDVAASMGNGVAIHSEQIVDHLAFREEWIRTELGANPKNLILISAVGDSMEPTLRAGDLLLIDRGVEGVKQDAIYAFATNGELRVKRMQLKIDGSVVVKSDNSQYDPEILTAEQASSIRLVGRVVWSGRRM